MTTIDDFSQEGAQIPLLHLALGAARGHDFARASNLFERALETHGIEVFWPEALSYYGLTAATAGKRSRAGVEFCRMARQMEPEEPLHVLNEARCRLVVGQKREAIELLEDTLDQFPGDAGLAALRTELGVRRRPVLGFLDRRHPINRLLGQLRRR